MDSSSTYRTWLYDLFPSFYGPDVYKIFLRPLLRQFGNNLITVFNDNEIERGAVTIGPKLMQAIRASRISLVVLSNNYASSRWCLNELLEILKCKEETGQIMMTIFYGVDPSDVQKQTGDFGKAFKETCCHSTEEKKKRWTQALTHVGNIAGEHFLKWDKEPDAIEKMATYVIRNVTNTVFSSDHTMIVDPTTARKRHNKSLDDPKQFVLKVCISKPSVWYSIGMSFVVVIANLLLEIASAVADQLSSIRKPYFARISLVMSILSLILTILDLTCKVRAGKARFRCKWPIPWFYYPSRGYSRIFGSSTDIILSFCAVGQLIVSTINFSFTERGRDGPIKISVWPLFFAIGMVLSKFMEKPTISKK